MMVRTDCRHYRTSEPCEPHKSTGTRCDGCAVYDPIRERLLIVKLGAMGDVLRTTTCLEPLKQRHPASHVTWVTRANARPLLEGNPAIDRILSVEDNYLELLMSERFDVAIGPDTDPVSAAIMALVRADTKYGFAADGRGGITPLSDAARDWWLTGIDDARKRANRRTYGEWLYAMCDLSGPVARPCIDVPSPVRASVTQRLRSLRPERTRWIGFNTGAGGRWAEKHWKPAHYQRLAELLETARPDCGIVLVGGPEQKELNERLRLAHPSFVDGGTDNSVAEFAALVKACDWIVTADTLGYHLACAVGTPAVCLVGPTSPWELDTFNANCVLSAPLDCIACYRAQCPFDITCMDRLSADVVWARVREWRADLTSSSPRTTLAAPEPARQRTSLAADVA